MDTMYRRRVAGTGRRTGSKKRSTGLSLRERRRLIQLIASMLLFFLVYLGRGVLPQQATAWKLVLSSDMDFAATIAAFGEAIAEGKGILGVLDMLQTDGKEGAESPASAEKGVEAPQISMVPYAYRANVPGFGARPVIEQNVKAETALSETKEETAPEEPIVTAVAQQYSEEGELLPDNVSFQYYNLGLEETTVPVMGSVTSAFGFRNHPVDGEYSFHSAVDIGAETGTEILAFGDGQVRYIGENDVFGLYLKIDHDNGVSTFYAHCDELLVKKGDVVTCGDVIAKAGETGNATGPHLHFSIEKDGVRLDPDHYLDLS